jgi:hypothetical protein
VIERVAPIRVDSPCVGLCRIDEQGLCEGCARTLDEIAGWTRMTVGERERVMHGLKERRPSCHRFEEDNRSSPARGRWPA